MIQRQSIWCAGLSGLSRSSHHTHETDRRNQMNQFPATRREIIPGTYFSHVPYDERPHVAAADEDAGRCIGKALGLLLSEIRQEHQDVAHRNHADQFSTLRHAEMSNTFLGHQIAGI